MFGLFKKTVSPTDFGNGIISLTNEFLTEDAVRSLAMRFENYDVSGGAIKFFESHGLPVVRQLLYLRLYAHCAVQAACTQFAGQMRRAITEGAIATFHQCPEGYEFETTYKSLEDAYSGQHKFDRRVEPLNNPMAQLSFLPKSNVGVLNAKYLIQSFVIPHMKNSQAFINDFSSYSMPVSTSITTVQRSMNHILKSHKIS